MLYTTTQSFRCILGKEYQLLLDEVNRYSRIKHADERLFEEVELFLESIRASRRELKRELSKLRCTCPKSYKESTYVASRSIEIERTVEIIEEIDNGFMKMMNWYDNPSDKECHS